MWEMRAGSLRLVVHLVDAPFAGPRAPGPRSTLIGASLRKNSLRVHPRGRTSRAAPPGMPGYAPGLAAADARVGALRLLTVLPAEPGGDVAVSVVGLGAGTPDDARRGGAAAGRAFRSGHTDVTLTADVSAAAMQAFIEGFVLAAYRVCPVGPERPQSVAFNVPARRLDRVGRVLERCAAVWWARAAANAPSNVKSPAWLADEVIGAARDLPIEVSVRGRSDLAALSAGGLLAVGAGSRRDPLLVRLDYRPAAARRHVALIGKGITFDSGGLSLKPRTSMALMKTDMAGAAAVAGAVLGAARLGLPVAVSAYLALAENMPGADAMRPGDVIVHPGGRTTEVLNTDAEGRLVLADALALIDQEVPTAAAVVDLATLTGAATMALSRHVGAILTRNDRLAAALLDAGSRSGDALWRLPLVDDYAGAMASPVADAANIATDPTVSAGAITAALFLEPFAPGVPWAHLDIAGPARAESDTALSVKGATGYGVRLLLEWLGRGAPV